MTLGQHCSQVLFCQQLKVPSFILHDQLTSEDDDDSRTMPNPDTWGSNFKEDSAAFGWDFSEFAGSFLSVSTVLGFLFTVGSSRVFGGIFFFLFLFLDMVDFCAETRGAGGCCLF